MIALVECSLPQGQDSNGRAPPVSQPTEERLALLEQGRRTDLTTCRWLNEQRQRHQGTGEAALVPELSAEHHALFQVPARNRVVAQHPGQSPGHIERLGPCSGSRSGTVL